MCPEEGLDGRCVPSCVCYTCSVHHNPSTILVQIVPSGLLILQRIFPQPDRIPLVPESPEIFHVPKIALA